MPKRPRPAELPREVMPLMRYSQLDLYMRKFAIGELGLILLLGRPGTGKSEAVKRALRISALDEITLGLSTAPVLYVEGHMKPYGLYSSLWKYRNRLIVLDDLDKLYADADCIRLLKPLCNTERVRRIAWLTNTTLNDAKIPVSFTTTSRVILIANEWRTLNPNVQALEDRAIILHFDPSNVEVHRKVGEWFQDQEVYQFIAGVIPCIKTLSMRHYSKASLLRKAGLRDWRSSVLHMVLHDARLACVAALQAEPTLCTEQERIDRFRLLTGYSRSTYFRTKSRLRRTL